VGEGDVSEFTGFSCLADESGPRYERLGCREGCRLLARGRLRSPVMLPRDGPIDTSCLQFQPTPEHVKAWREKVPED
jgi:hypothetical protein